MQSFSEILATHLGESWTHHLCLGLTIFYNKVTKNVLVELITFLAHLAKGNVSFCHHLASVVC
jgi:hypothetical protein